LFALNWGLVTVIIGCASFIGLSLELKFFISSFKKDQKYFFPLKMRWKRFIFVAGFFNENRIK